MTSPHSHRGSSRRRIFKGIHHKTKKKCRRYHETKLVVFWATEQSLWCHHRNKFWKKKKNNFLVLSSIYFFMKTHNSKSIRISNKSISNSKLQLKIEILCTKWNRDVITARFFSIVSLIFIIFLFFKDSHNLWHAPLWKNHQI